MSVAKITKEYDGVCELVHEQESNELTARYDLNHKVDGTNDGNGFFTFVANVRRAIYFTNIALQSVRCFTQPDESGAGSSIKDDNEMFRLSYRRTKVFVNLIIRLRQYE